MVKKGVILLSGGLDSSTVLYLAKSKGYECYPLIIDYGQRHAREIDSARKVAEAAGFSYKLLKVGFPWKGSSLLDKGLKIPAPQKSSGIPSTYVPGRNIVFLSLAVSYAEAIGAEAVLIGANSIDFSGYPDCRPEFYEKFIDMVRAGTKAGDEGKPIKIEAPLLSKTKAEIVKMGTELGVPYELTWSCYKGGRAPCGKCESCLFRAKGFREAGLDDPAYVDSHAARMGTLLFSHGDTSQRRFLSRKRSAPTALREVSPPRVADITETFSSIQGEGIYVGVKQIFVRFKKCNLKCAYCDLPANLPAKRYSASELISEIGRLEAKDGPHHSISFTGGEPLLYTVFLKKALPLLKKAGYRVYLETNGTLPKELKRIIDLVDIIAMDFKLPSSTGEAPLWEEHSEFLKVAQGKEVFVKAIVTPSTIRKDVEKAIEIIKGIDDSIPFILQPVSSSNTVKNRIVSFLELSRRSGLGDSNAMPQVHKIMGVR